MRARPRTVRTWRATAPLLSLLLVSGCGSGTASVQPEPRPQASWTRLPDAPLSPRTNPVVVWTGTAVLAFGGETGDTCPPLADCAVANEVATDGAALDLGTGTWSPIAAAPLPVPGAAPAAVVDGHVLLPVAGRLLDYDVARDRWELLHRKVAEGYTPVTDGDRLLLVSGSDETGDRPDLVYRPATRTWSSLPADPFGPMSARTVVATGDSLVLTGSELVDDPGGEDGPSYVVGAVLDRRTGAWSKLPRSDQIGLGTWAAIGDRVVDVSLDGSDGGEVNGYGRTIPYGGVLDLAARRWERLPHPPAYGSGGWGVNAAGSRLIAAEGYLYDDAAATWTRVPRPEGAAVRPGPAVWAGDRLVVVGGANRTDTNATNRNGTVWSLEPVTGALQ